MTSKFSCYILPTILLNEIKFLLFVNKSKICTYTIKVKWNIQEIFPSRITRMRIIKEKLYSTLFVPILKEIEYLSLVCSNKDIFEIKVVKNGTSSYFLTFILRCRFLNTYDKKIFEVNLSPRKIYNFCFLL